MRGKEDDFSAPSGLRCSRSLTRRLARKLYCCGSALLHFYLPGPRLVVVSSSRAPESYGLRSARGLREISRRDYPERSSFPQLISREGAGWLIRARSWDRCCRSPRLAPPYVPRGAAFTIVEGRFTLLSSYPACARAFCKRLAGSPRVNASASG